ncbi:MAG: hypothetical protein BroJett003_22340 [Planctomycetota bacterium]|nr:MAG: hypothetical protein BroJett003_22340 [Planctomycetota bacterium]
MTPECVTGGDERTSRFERKVMNTLTKNIVPGILILVITHHLTLACGFQEDGAEELTRIILNTQPGIERVQAFQELSKFSAPERELAYRRICREGDESAATMVSAMLLEAGGPDNVDIVLERTRRASDEFHRVILQRARGLVASDVAVSVARCVLQTNLSRPPTQLVYPDDGEFQAIDIAALLLGRWSTNPRDVELLCEIAQAYSGSCGTWLALGNRDLGEAMRDRARATIRDGAVDQLARCAAAAMLARHDAEASAYLRQQVTVFLGEFSNWNRWEAMSRERDRPEPDPDFVSKMQRFKRGMNVLGMMLLAKPEDARAIYRSSVSAVNHDIQIMSCLAFAMRWPDEFFEVEDSLRRNSELQSVHDSLLAVLVHKHPELRERARLATTEDRLHQAIERFANTGDPTGVREARWVVLLRLE